MVYPLWPINDILVNAIKQKPCNDLVKPTVSSFKIIIWCLSNNMEVMKKSTKFQLGICKIMPAWSPKKHTGTCGGNNRLVL